MLSFLAFSFRHELIIGVSHARIPFMGPSNLLWIRNPCVSVCVIHYEYVCAHTLTSYNKIKQNTLYSKGFVKCFVSAIPVIVLLYVWHSLCVRSASKTLPRNMPWEKAQKFFFAKNNLFDAITTNHIVKKIQNDKKNVTLPLYWSMLFSLDKKWTMERVLGISVWRSKLCDAKHTGIIMLKGVGNWKRALH